jgi:hypothetical protein
MIAYESVPGGTTPPTGLFETLEAAGITAARSRDGVHVSDVAAAASLLAGYVGSPVQLAFNQSAARLSLAAVFADRIAAGRVYAIPGDASGAHIYQIDAASVANITGAVAWASADGAGITGVAAWPAGFAWIDAGNVAVPMTAPECAAFASDVGAYLSALILNNRSLKDAVAAAPDLAALAAIDVGQGWPRNV